LEAVPKAVCVLPKLGLKVGPLERAGGQRGAGFESNPSFSAKRRGPEAARRGFCVMMKIGTREMNRVSLVPRGGLLRPE
jgi:hypothetical protein